MNDLSNSNAAKNRFCCTCGKYCNEDEVYFSASVHCGWCYTLQDFINQKRFFIVPRSVREKANK